LRSDGWKEANHPTMDMDAYSTIKPDNQSLIQNIGQ